MRGALILLVLSGPAAAGSEADCVAHAEARRAAHPQDGAAHYHLALAACLHHGGADAPAPALPAAPQRASLPAPPCAEGRRCLPEVEMTLHVLSGERWRYGAAVLLPGDPETAAVCAEVGGLIGKSPAADRLIAIGAASQEGDPGCEAWRACTRARMLATVASEVGRTPPEHIRVWNVERHRETGAKTGCDASPDNADGVCTALERPRVLLEVRGRGEATDAELVREYWRRCAVQAPPTGCLDRVNFPGADALVADLDRGCGPEPATCRARQPEPSGAELCAPAVR